MSIQEQHAAPAATNVRPADAEAALDTALAQQPAEPGLPQPWSGLIGLALVLAVAALLGLGLGAQRSLEVIGPLSTFCLPVLAVAALWWNGWPAAKASRPVAGLTVTALIVGVGLLLTAVGQFVVGSPAFGHLLGTASETPKGHLVTFPWTVPLAAFVFATTLQLTFVCRKWPFASLKPVSAGLAALGTSWLVGIAGYFLLANWDFVPAPARAAIGLRNPGGPVNALDLIAILLCIVVWQMVVFFLLEGYPLSKINSTAGYLVAANATTIGLGVLTWIALHNGLDRTVPQVSAFAGVVVAGTLVVGLLFEAWPVRAIANDGARRLALLGAAGVVAVIAGFGLRAISVAAESAWTDPAQLWVAVAALNFVSAVIILHAVVWRRWPVPVGDG